MNGAALGRELERVRDEVLEDLHHPATIGMYLRHGVEDARERDGLRCSARFQRLDSFAHDTGEVDLLRLEGQLAGLQASDEEEVVHQTEQPIRVACDDLQKAAHLVSEIVLERELHVAGDRRERRAQVVGDQRHEFVLQPVGFTQPLVLLGEQPLRGLGLGAGEPFRHTQRIERVDDAREAEQYEPAEDACADGDRARVDGRAGRRLDQEHGRSGRKRGPQQTQPQRRHTRCTGARRLGQFPHRRIQSRDAPEDVRQQPGRVQPRRLRVGPR